MAAHKVAIAVLYGYHDICQDFRLNFMNLVFEFSQAPRERKSIVRGTKCNSFVKFRRFFYLYVTHG